MKNLKKIISVFLIIVMLPINSIYGESRPKARDIPEKTIIIGTYIIDLETLNAEILKVARESATKNPDNVHQNNVYFKSDINRGAWYDITNGGDITNIAGTTDNLVSEEVIDALMLTHYAKPNGKIVEFASGNTVSINTLDSVNVPSEMDELEELVKEQDIILSAWNALDDSEENDGQRAAYFWEHLSTVRALTTINDSDYREYTNQLDALDGFIDFLRNQKKAGIGLIELVVAEKMYISSAREIHCYQTEVDRINFELAVLNYGRDQVLIQKYSGALTELQASMLELEANTKGSPNNSTEKVYAKYSDEMLSLARIRNFEAAYISLLKMNATNNLMIETIEDKLLEIEMANEAKKDVLNKLNRELNSGGSADYKRAVKNNEHRDMLEKLKKESVQQCELYMDELNTVTGYIIMRTDSVKGKANEAKKTQIAYEEMLASLAETDLKNSLQASLSAEQETAVETAYELKLEASEAYMEVKKEADALTAEVKAVNEKYLGAVEENDKESADAYKEALRNAQNDLEAAEIRLEAVADSVGAQEDFAVNPNVVSTVGNILSDMDGLLDEIKSGREEAKASGEKTPNSPKEILDKIKPIVDGNIQKLNDMGSGKGDELNELEGKSQGLKEKIEETEQALNKNPDEAAAIKGLVSEALEIQGSLYFADKDTFVTPFIDVSMGDMEAILGAGNNPPTAADEIPFIRDLDKIETEGKTEKETMKEKTEILKKAAGECSQKNNAMLLAGMPGADKLADSLDVIKDKLLGFEDKLSDGDTEQGLAGDETALKNELQALENEIKEAAQAVLSLGAGAEGALAGDAAVNQLENGMQSIIDEMKENAGLMSDENIEALIQELESIDLKSPSAVDKMLAAAEKLTPLLEAKDLQEKLDSLAKIIDSTVKKIDENEKLAADSQVAALKEQLNEIKNSAESLPEDMASMEQGGQSGEALMDMSKKTEELIAKMEAVQEQLSDVANAALEMSVEIPSKESVQAEFTDENEDPLITEQLKLYSSDEKAQAKAVMNRIEAGDKNCEAIEPWRLIFRDYRIKLASPAVGFGKEIYVPVLEITRQMGAEIIYEKAADRIVVKDKGVLIEFENGGKDIYISDRKMSINPEVQYILGQFYIPLSCIEKAYGLTDTDIQGYTVVYKGNLY